METITTAPVALAPEGAPPEAAAPGLKALADMPPQAPLTAAELAAVLGCCVASVQRAGRRGELPPPVRFMGRHVWTAGAVLAHLGEKQAAAVALADKRTARIPRLAP